MGQLKIRNNSDDGWTVIGGVETVYQSASAPTAPHAGMLWFDTDAVAIGGHLLQDADSDTVVNCEETLDEDTIRFDCGGTENVLTLTSSAIAGSLVKDEDDMASDSANHVATQQSIKAYEDTTDIWTYGSQSVASGSVWTIISSLPAYASEIVILGNAWSPTATGDTIVLQLKNSTTWETAGYVFTAGYSSGAEDETNGWHFHDDALMAAGDTCYTVMRIARANSTGTVWCMSGSCTVLAEGSNRFLTGSKTLTSRCTGVRLWYASAGAGDAGTVYWKYR